ncbi:unnamed protein product [Caenorhabditis auriculariae]|uniref:Multifunctional fusion protein n=1 Tax=Caenorhabditis auriculariae TaxID=2777116 RepID=A0A8S1H0P7_9PELO|nr:unnamed protein product [Caenorhabditis auriculariae]
MRGSFCSNEDRSETEESQQNDDDMPPLDNRHLNLIHEELEKLNIATDIINKLEVLLDGARATFRETQGTCHIAKARPYYELRSEERKLREESQKAAERFERATSLLAVAKQQVSLTQDSLSRQSTVLPECLEVLNHHIQRVSEAEEERMGAEALHAAKAHAMLQLVEKIRKIEKENRSSIKKSRKYFEKRLEFTLILESQKEQILRLEKEVRQKKNDYTTSLRNLERISDQIHEERSLEGSSEDSTTESSSSPSVPGNPPPYQPTAPPPYEDEYAIEKLPDDDSMVLSVMKEDDQSEKMQRSLGSGVILLAQQLIRSANDRSPNSNNSKLHAVESEPDISYHTRPIGLADSPDSLSDVSSVVFTDDESLPAMLMSHSDLIKEIENATDRVGSILRNKRSVSDVCESDQQQGAAALGFRKLAREVPEMTNDDTAAVGWQTNRWRMKAENRLIGLVVCFRASPPPRRSSRRRPSFTLAPRLTPMCPTLVRCPLIVSKVAMSWADMVNNSLIGTGNVSKGAICGYDGSIWGKSENFKITEEEAIAAGNAFKQKDAVLGSGLKFEGEKYFVLNADDERIIGKKASSGFFIYSTHQTVIITIYEGGLQPESCSSSCTLHKKGFSLFAVLPLKSGLMSAYSRRIGIFSLII